MTRHEPVLVTMRMRKGLPRLRSKRVLRSLSEVFELAAERFGFRLVHYSIQNDHLHLICEANHRRALSRGLQGFSIRVARALNRLWDRRGKVFGDRYHDRVLRTPRQVRNALRYVLNNARKHGRKLIGKLDPFASGFWFSGWKGVRGLPVCHEALPEPPLARAHSWLLGVGWRRHGKIAFGERPGPAPG